MGKLLRCFGILLLNIVIQKHPVITCRQILIMQFGNFIYLRLEFNSKEAKKIQDSIMETFSYYDFPREHRVRIRTNNALERIMKEIRRRTRVVGAFPDGHSALMLCAARLRHIAGTKWGSKRYLNMDLLKEQELELKFQMAEAI